jgi:hypothetical protein
MATSSSSIGEVMMGGCETRQASLAFQTITIEEENVE